MLKADPGRRRRLPDTVISEPSILLDLFPILSANLSRPPSQQIYLSDDSKEASVLL